MMTTEESAQAIAGRISTGSMTGQSIAGRMIIGSMTDRQMGTKVIRLKAIARAIGGVRLEMAAEKKGRPQMFKH